MTKKTAMKSLHEKVRHMIPSSARTEEKMALQRAYSDLTYEIKEEYFELEKQQLKEAFEMGAAYASILHVRALDIGDLDEKFEKHYSKYTE